MNDEQIAKSASQSGGSRAKLRASGTKALAFALMLTVPVALSGCNTASSNDCEDYNGNNYCDDDGSAYMISNGKKIKKSKSTSSGYKSSSSSSKGFGSSGFSSGG